MVRHKILGQELKIQMLQIQAHQKRGYLEALQTSTAKKIVKVVEALERVDENGKEDPDFETVKEILNELLEKKDSLRSYDRSVMWNYWGYVYFQKKDFRMLCRHIEIFLLNLNQQFH